MEIVPGVPQRLVTERMRSSSLSSAPAQPPGYRTAPFAFHENRSSHTLRRIHVVHATGAPQKTGHLAGSEPRSLPLKVFAVCGTRMWRGGLLLLPPRLAASAA